MPQKILPYDENTTYDTYNVHRNVNAVLKTLGEDAEAWFYNAFVQVCSAKDLYGVPLLFNYNTDMAHFEKLIYQECPLFESYPISDDALTLKWSNLPEFCVDMIKNNYYISTVLDQHYIKLNNIEQPGISFHDITIYGFDEDEEKLLCIDFVGHKAKSNWITFDEINTAYIAGKRYIPYYNSIFTFRVTDKFNWKFDIKNYAESIEAYINCMPTVLFSYKYARDFDYAYSGRNNYYFGFDTYKLFYMNFEEARKYNNGLDRRIYYTFMKHKLVMLNSVKYISKKGYIEDDSLLDQFESIYKQSRIIFNLIMKYNRKSDTKIIDQINNLFREAEADEREAFDTLLRTLSRSINTMTVCTNGVSCHDIEKLQNDNNKYIDKTIYDKGKYIVKLFYGKTLKLLANTGRHYGECMISVDGSQYIYNQYSDVPEYGKTIYEKNDFSDDFHLLRAAPAGDTKINISEIICSDIETAKQDISYFRYAGNDEKTNGNWIGRYGSIGYDIFKPPPEFPDNIFVLYKYATNDTNHEIVRADNIDIRALQEDTGDGRYIPVVYDRLAIYIEIAVINGVKRKVSLYFLDCLKTGVEQRISVVNMLNDEEVYSTVIKDFYNGIYITFELCGLYRIHIRNTFTVRNNTDALLNGIFFD